MARYSLPLIFSAVLISGCGDKVKPGSVEVSRRVVAGAEVAEVAATEVTEEVELTGTVRAKSISNVASRVMGTVTSVAVREGDAVKAGQVLLTIDNRDARERVAAAEAALREAGEALKAVSENKRLADITYERYKKLYDEKAISRQEFDEIEARRNASGHEYGRVEAIYRRAEAGLKEARVYEGFTRVTSPVSGIVTSKNIDTGSMASPGMPLFTVEDTSSYTIDVYADESYLQRIRPGLEVDVIIDSAPEAVKGTVVEAVPSVNPASRAFLVKVSVKAPLKTGLFARVRMPVGRKSLLLVPSRAIVSRGQLTGVYTVAPDGVVTYRLVRTGPGYDGKVEVLSGISPGDRVILDGAAGVDGGVVK